jgi:hypothetical protein
MISAALQRRVWFGTENNALFPGSFFVVLVGGPGIGKSRIATWCGEPILRSFITGYVEGRDGKPKPVYKLPFSADCTTFESMIEYLAKATRNFIYQSKTDPKPRTYGHNTLCVLLAKEMASLFRKNMDDISTLFRICYDAEHFHYATRTKGDFEIRNVCMSFLGCINFTDLKKIVRSGLVDNGFISRLIFVVEDFSRSNEPFFEITEEKKKLFDEIREWIKQITEVKGELSYSSEARVFYDRWYRTKFSREKERREFRFNKEAVLDEYYARKDLHVQKLAVAIHFCKSISMVIEEDDLREALRELEKIELNMHKALMTGGSNELAVITQDILKFLGRKSEGASLNEILIELWSNADRKMILESLEYLTTVTCQVRWDTEKRKYSLMIDGENQMYSDSPV